MKHTLNHQRTDIYECVNACKDLLENSNKMYPEYTTNLYEKYECDLIWLVCGEIQK